MSNDWRSSTFLKILIGLLVLIGGLLLWKKYSSRNDQDNE
jgi:hypothetical protein